MDSPVDTEYWLIDALNVILTIYDDPILTNRKKLDKIKFTAEHTKTHVIIAKMAEKAGNAWRDK